MLLYSALMPYADVKAQSCNIPDHIQYVLLVCLGPKNEPFSSIRGQVNDDFNRDVLKLERIQSMALRKQCYLVSAVAQIKLLTITIHVLFTASSGIMVLLSLPAATYIIIQ